MKVLYGCLRLQESIVNVLYGNFMNKGVHCKRFLWQSYNTGEHYECSLFQFYE